MVAVQIKKYKKKIYLVINPADTNMKVLADFNYPFLMISYAYWKRRDPEESIMKYYREKPHVMIDSGAFSAWSQGVQISLDDLLRYYNQYDHFLEEFVGLDDLTDDAITVANNRYMKLRGRETIPVFHFGEPLKYLEEMAKGWDYLGLASGGSPYTGSDRIFVSWVDKILQYVRQNLCLSDRKYHIFGSLNPMLFKLGAYSADGAHWLHTARTGQVQIFSPWGKNLLCCSMARRKYSRTKLTRYLPLIRENITKIKEKYHQEISLKRMVTDNGIFKEQMSEMLRFNIGNTLLLLDYLNEGAINHGEDIRATS